MKSFRIFTIMLIIAALATPVLATPYKMDSTRVTPLTGPYAGIFGGFNWADADSNDAAIPETDPDGWEGGVFVGYKFDSLFGSSDSIGYGVNGAIEAFYAFSDADDRVGGVTVEKDNEWGVSFRPGLSFIDRTTGNNGINPYGILSL